MADKEVKNKEDLTLGQLQKFKEDMEKSILTMVQNRMKKFHDQTGLHVTDIKLSIHNHYIRIDGFEKIDKTVVDGVQSEIHI